MYQLQVSTSGLIGIKLAILYPTMPKARKARIAAAQGVGDGGDAKRKAYGSNKKSKMNTFPRLSTNANNKNNSKKNNNNGKIQKNQRPIVPFGRNDRVLLIGEGEFSINPYMSTLECYIYGVLTK